MYTVRTEQSVVPGRLADYVAFQREASEFLRGQPGFIWRGVARSLGEPLRFRAIVRWDSQQHNEAALGSPAWRDIIKCHGPADLATWVTMPESYELVHNVRGPAFEEGKVPGLVAERPWELKPGIDVARAFIDSRKELFDLAAKHVPGFFAHSLYRYRGSTRRFLLLNSYRSADDFVGWHMRPSGVPEIAAFVQAHSDENYVDVNHDFSLWQPGAV